MLSSTASIHLKMKLGFIHPHPTLRYQLLPHDVTVACSFFHFLFSTSPPSNCWLPFQWETDGRPLLWATAKWSKFSLQRLQALFILSKPHLHPLHHFAIWCVQHLFPMQTCHFAMPRFADYRIFITLSTEWQKQTSFVLWGCLEWSVASLLGLGNKMISIIIMNKFPQYR